VEAGLEGCRGVRRRDRKTGKVNGPARASISCSLQLAAAGAGRGLRHGRAQKKFVQDFVAAWNKVMNLDRFDLRK